MAGSTPFAPSSVPPVSSLLKDKVLGLKNQQQIPPMSASRLLSNKKMSTVGSHSHKSGDQPVNPINRKSSVFTIENLLAPSVKSPASPPVAVTTRPSANISPISTSPASLSASEMVQQQLQYHHQQNLFSVVGHHHHPHIMPLALADPAAYSYTYLGKLNQYINMLYINLYIYASLFARNVFTVPQSNQPNSNQ